MKSSESRLAFEAAKLWLWPRDFFLYATNPGSFPLHGTWPAFERPIDCELDLVDLKSYADFVGKSEPQLHASTGMLQFELLEIHGQ